MKLLKSALLRKLAFDTSIFMFFSLIITFLSTRLPVDYYHYEKWIYKERKWENGGRFYQDIFKVKLWKSRLPELADFIKYIFPKKHIEQIEDQYISEYLMESCKAEFTHWCIIFSSFLFLVYNGTLTFFYILLLSIVLNVPFIIIQRYNRPRIIKIMKQKGLEF